MYPQRSVMTCGLATALEPPHFNPRTRVGCNRARMAGYGRFHASFNPRTRVECDCACPADACAKCCFNPRTRVGCDGMTFYRSCVGGGFQSTHPRRVRPRGQHPADLLRRVSIHAPAWGATGTAATRTSGPHGFQSTHPRGVRLARQIMPDTAETVSIHAPAWGATPYLLIRRRAWMVSIHAPAWGATLSCRLMSGLSARFQSTHPRGVRRLSWMPTGATMLGFQSTHPRGVRLQQVQHIPAKRLVSIHAPAWGATQQRVLFDLAADVSIHAPAWGATCDGTV